MMNPQENIAKRNDMRIKRQAQAWLVDMTAGEVTLELRTAFEAWCAEDPRHELEYRQAEQMVGRLDDICDLAALEPLDDMMVQERVVSGFTNMTGTAARWAKRPLMPIAGAGLAAALLAIIVLVQVWPLPPREIATEIAEIKDVSLPDGSTVTLGARSTIELDFSDQERRVVLSEGEAFFSVVKDPARPFVVHAGETLVRVVGTKFDVHRGVEQVRVAVLEGVVEVMRPPTATALEPIDTAPSKRVLRAGEHIVTASRGPLLEALVRTRAAPPGAWRDGRLIYVDAPLSEVIADANRYFDGDIIFASDDLAQLRVTAAFRTDQIEDMIDSLTVGLPVEADRASQERIILRPQKEGG